MKQSTEKLIILSGFLFATQTSDFLFLFIFVHQFIWKWFIFGQATPEQEISAIYIFDTRSKGILTKIMQMDSGLI